MNANKGTGFTYWELNEKDDCGFTLEEFLIKEMGEYFEDLIYLDFDMTVGEFCAMFIEKDEEDGCWVSTI